MLRTHPRRETRNSNRPNCRICTRDALHPDSLTAEPTACACAFRRLSKTSLSGASIIRLSILGPCTGTAATIRLDPAGLYGTSTTHTAAAVYSGKPSQQTADPAYRGVAPHRTFPRTVRPRVLDIVKVRRLELGKVPIEKLGSKRPKGRKKELFSLRIVKENGMDTSAM